MKKLAITHLHFVFVLFFAALGHGQGWMTQNIGSPGQSGTFSESGGTLTVEGGGADIWGTSDQFFFVYQLLDGDGEITARVASLENTHEWAKAGVMMRQTLDANSIHAHVVVTPSNGTELQRRETTGAEAINITSSGSVPYWIRLARSGNTFTGSVSSDGSSWTQVGAVTISMSSQIHVGLPVCSHDNGTLGTAIFDNVSITGGSGPGAGLLREIWTGISGTSVSTLTGNSNYPDFPSTSNIISTFEGPSNTADNYGTRVRGYVTAPVTGNYTFWVSGDDNCELWISSDRNPSNISLIAAVPGYTNSREWTKYSEQQSSAIALIGGQQYYIEMLHKEGSGGDNFAVGWQGPGITGDSERPIPNARLKPWTGIVIEPATITTHPVGVNVYLGDPATLSVTASGTEPLSYQWRKAENILAGENSSVLHIASTVIGSGGTYDCIVSNTAGADTSNWAYLRVGWIPRIVTHPTSQTVLQGADVTLIVRADGNPIGDIQWRKNGVDIPGATVGDLILTAVDVSDAGNYDAVVTNEYGSATSDIAVLTVTSAPVIVSQPADQTVSEGETATFSVSATGTAPLTYQWRKNGANISGATSPSFTTPTVSTIDNGAQFSVVVSNTISSVTSNAATLTVNLQPPTITSQPSDQNISEGETATFSVTATGTALSYQWRKNGADISGATSPSYTTPAATLADDGAHFDVIVSNSGGNLTSNTATLNVTARQPVITTHPVSQSINEGETATFTVTATSSAPMTYQWQKDGANISGATSSTYITPAASLADNGSQFTVIVTNLAGSVTSDPATLTVLPLPPVITSHPISQIINEGQTASFTVTATSSEVMTYQWRKNSVNIAGATSSSYVTAAATIADNGAIFDVVVSNAGGNITSNAAILTVNTLPPVITTQPTSQTVNDGETASFTVAATSSVTMTYQWRKNGTNIGGATSSSYTTSALSLADDGAQFDVIITNAGGNVTSDPATVNINAMSPTITTQPSNQTVIEGGTATFTVVATGSAPLSYQWRKDGVDITGAVSSSYKTPSVSLSDDGAEFDVVVSNFASNVTSIVAVLTVTATTPQNKKLAISGELVDDAGNPIGYPTPTDVDVTVVLYNDETAGSALYTETFLTANSQQITVEDGLFVARLGEGTTSDNLQTIVSTNAGLWVEITIDDGTPEVLVPRTPLTAAAYSLGGTPSDASVLKGSGAPDALAIEAAIGAYYVNTDDESTWMRVYKGWKRVD